MSLLLHVKTTLIYTALLSQHVSHAIFQVCLKDV